MFEKMPDTDYTEEMKQLIAELEAEAREAKSPEMDKEDETL